jgi:hypothetical protein
MKYHFISKKKRMIEEKKKIGFHQKMRHLIRAIVFRQKRGHKLWTTFGQKQGTKSLLDKMHSQMVSFFLIKMNSFFF